jgi:hypothetical protein
MSGTAVQLHGNAHKTWWLMFGCSSYRRDMSSSTTITTPQALQAWDTALRLLGEVKAHAAAHPDQLDIPEGLSNNLDSTTGLLSTAKQSSPVAAWRQMLKKKVSTLGQLSATEDSLTRSVHHMAAVLKSPSLLACLD